MNYSEHYNRLITRARNRESLKPCETHHILPRCMGGTNDNINLVDLTPEEHYVAHQLLVKIYPDNRGLIHAAIMMTVKSKNHGRSKNKLYGWLKRKLSIAASDRQTGINNSQFGSIWVYNTYSGVSKKIKKEDFLLYVDQGWIKGRNLTKNKCVICNKDFFAYRSTIKSCNDSACRHDIRLRGGRHDNARRVLCDNIEYESLSAAARYYEINIETVKYRIKKGLYNYIN